jgi:nitrite reductase (NADH) small subunit
MTVALATSPLAEWVDVGAAADILPRSARVVRTVGGDVAVFRTATDAYYAIDNRCPHRGGPLSEGIVHGDAVTCPLHNWVINLATGKAVGADEGCVMTIPVKVEAGRLFLALASPDRTGVAHDRGI